MFEKLQMSTKNKGVNQKNCKAINFIDMVIS